MYPIQACSTDPVTTGDVTGTARFVAKGATGSRRCGTAPREEPRRERSPLANGTNPPRLGWAAGCSRERSDQIDGLALGEPLQNARIKLRCPPR